MATNMMTVSEYNLEVLWNLKKMSSDIIKCWICFLKDQNTTTNGQNNNTVCVWMCVDGWIIHVLLLTKPSSPCFCKFQFLYCYILIFFLFIFYKMYICLFIFSNSLNYIAEFLYIFCEILFFIVSNGTFHTWTSGINWCSLITIHWVLCIYSVMLL